MRAPGLTRGPVHPRRHPPDRGSFRSRSSVGSRRDRDERENGSAEHAIVAPGGAFSSTASPARGALDRGECRLRKRPVNRLVSAAPSRPALPARVTAVRRQPKKKVANAASATSPSARRRVRPGRAERRAACGLAGRGASLRRQPARSIATSTARPRAARRRTDRHQAANSSARPTRRPKTRCQHDPERERGDEHGASAFRGVAAAARKRRREATSALCRAAVTLRAARRRARARDGPPAAARRRERQPAQHDPHPRPGQHSHTARSTRALDEGIFKGSNTARRAYGTSLFPRESRVGDLGSPAGMNGFRPPLPQAIACGDVTIPAATIVPMATTDPLARAHARALSAAGYRAPARARDRRAARAQDCALTAQEIADRLRGRALGRPRQRCYRSSRC